MWIFFGFAVIALMRVIQKICSKRVSTLVGSGITFFHYGAYYQFLSAVFAFIFLCFSGFYGFNKETFLCALIMALLLALDLFSGLEAVKGTTLVVCNIFATGGLFVPCVLGIFLFKEPMNVLQWIGLGVFIVSIYFLSASSEKKKKAFSIKTLVMLVLSFLSNGLVMVVQKYFALLLPDGNVALFSFLTFGLNAVILLACMIFLATVKSKDKNGVKINKIERLSGKLALYGMLLALAIFSINQIVTTLAKSVSSVALFTVTSALSVIITCIVGVAMFKEKLTVKNIIGLLLGFASIVIVNLF